jgi:hypothetical protein
LATCAQFGPGTIRVVARSAGDFGETQQLVNLPGTGAYAGLSRLSDGVFMLNSADRALLRVIADGAVVPTPTPLPLVAVDRIVGPDVRVSAVAGRWVFIAAYGADYKFVRHDGVTQQDIPIEAGLDIRSFTVASTGAIDFLAIRTATDEKVRGAVAAGATATTTSAAGVLDPAQVVAFTRIN